MLDGVTFKENSFTSGNAGGLYMYTNTNSDPTPLDAVALRVRAIDQRSKVGTARLM